MLSAVLFLGFARMTLPVAPDELIQSQYPWWAKSLSIGKLQLYEAIFLFWAPVGLLKGVLSPNFIFLKISGKKALRSLAALAIWTALVSLSGPQPWWDVNRSARLLLNIGVFATVYVWSSKRPLDPLVASILGLAYGTTANLIVTFTHPLIILDTVRMAGQNTAGVAMGVGIHLAAWWYYQEKRRWGLVLLFGCLGIFLWGGAISFSRIGWFTGLFGLGALLSTIFVSKGDKKRVRLSQLLPKICIIFLVVIPALAFIPKIRGIVNHSANLVSQKFLVYGADKESDIIRLSYLYASLEIALQNPLGVGYSGYLNEQKNISPKLKDILVEEEDNYDANPHAAFLWYLTAGGFLGGALAIYAFFGLLKTLMYSLRKVNSLIGVRLACLIIIPYFLIASTVTYIFSSYIMLVPIAVVSGWALKKNLNFSNISKSQKSNRGLRQKCVKLVSEN